MGQERESKPEIPEAVNAARDIYQEESLQSRENWKQDWVDELKEMDSKDEAEAAEILASFYAEEGGNPFQVVFYLEKTKLSENKKLLKLAENLESCAEFDFQHIDVKKEELERVKKYGSKSPSSKLTKEEVDRLEIRKNTYRKNAQILRQGAGLNN